MNIHVNILLKSSLSNIIKKLSFFIFTTFKYLFIQYMSFEQINTNNIDNSESLVKKTNTVTSRMSSLT